jgi:hypothetical protein
MLENADNMTLPVLERKCDKCDGTAIYSEGAGDNGSCDLCDGTGYLPTPIGRRILLLVKHAGRKNKK